MVANANTLGPLDAVISGYAYQNATNAIGALERDNEARKWLSAEMFCTLDNFVRTVLFNERIYLTGCADMDGDHFVPREPVYGGGTAGKQMLDAAHIFVPVGEIVADTEVVESNVATMLRPANPEVSPLFVIRCELPEKHRTILQEMVYLDAYFIEYAIAQFGAEHFKPVFPGEHLYLGLRQKRLTVPQATHSMADLPGARLRAVVREKMEKLNVFVSQGAPLLPELPPLFALRIIHDCSKGSDFIPILMKIRNHRQMVRFRKWLTNCWELSRGTDYAQRTKAAEAIRKLNEFSPGDDISKTEFGIAVLDIVKDVITHDVVGIIEQLASPLFRYLGGIPLSGLRQFGNKQTDPQRLDKFLVDNFGDKFNRNEMDYISNLLDLPDDLADWAKQNANVTVQAGRLESSAPPLARPCFIQTAAPAYVKNAQDDFNELLSRAERVTPELLAKWKKEQESKK